MNDIDRDLITARVDIRHYARNCRYPAMRACFSSIATRYLRYSFKQILTLGPLDDCLLNRSEWRYWDTISNFCNLLMHCNCHGTQVMNILVKCWFLSLNCIFWFLSVGNAFTADSLHNTFSNEEWPFLSTAASSSLLHGIKSIYYWTVGNYMYHLSDAASIPLFLVWERSLCEVESGTWPPDSALGLWSPLVSSLRYNERMF